MDKEEMEKRAKEVRDRMKAQRVLDIAKVLRDKKLLPSEKVDVLQDEMLGWNNDQLETMERFNDMAVNHAKMKKELHEAKVELQDTQVKLSAGERMHETSVKDLKKMQQRHERIHEKVAAVKEADVAMTLSMEDTQKLMNADDSTDEGQKVVADLFDKYEVEAARKLAQEMVKVKLIAEDGLEQQIEEMKTWDYRALSHMRQMIEERRGTNEPNSWVSIVPPRPSAMTGPTPAARNWSAGSDIANAHKKLHSISPSELRQVIGSQVEKEIVIDQPNAKQSIQSAFKEASKDRVDASKPISLSSYHKRGWIKDTKDEADRKTTKEPAFITELREARKLLEGFDEIFVNAKVEAVRAKEAVLCEERTYDGSKTHTDASGLYTLTMAQMKAERDYAIIEKVYKQAFKKFELVDVEQVSVEELNKALENFQVETTIYSELDSLFGGKYNTGDDPYYKWLARKKKVLSAEEAAELFGDMVSHLPSEVVGEMRKDKRSGVPFSTVAPHTQEDAHPSSDGNFHRNG